MGVAAIVAGMDTGRAPRSSSPELENATLRLQLLRALRSVDTAIEKVTERGEVTGLHRLREDLRAALRLHDGRPAMPRRA
jgi:hypothetical protein